MSKLDAQRAMREARYARDNASGPTRREAAAAAAAGTPTAPAAAAPVAGRTKPVQAAKAVPAAAAPTGERCGHKSMNGRECTREAGHPEKSHRYG
ncbi:hypothetical protein SAMN04488543_1647 [Friedmanniella luteola]|uniref:Uncharacterized protein n=1 Tax=Friedmanniella luteola TaxID=546871 RepID=A0A1H1RU29_9ACTN|nr:hypothetical protein [Friedmanniella luteola]SDS39213.1 hypothetical protein SAMN04488543_1647 [Friedmanniella luteola]